MVIQIQWKKHAKIALCEEYIATAETQATRETGTETKNW